MLLSAPAALGQLASSYSLFLQVQTNAVNQSLILWHAISAALTLIFILPEGFQTFKLGHVILIEYDIQGRLINLL